MTVVDDCAAVIPTVSLEVKTQDLPVSADFCKAKAQEAGDILEGNLMSNLLQNLLEDDEDNED